MLSPVTEWQTNCRRCGAELSPAASTCAHCGQATERKLPRDSMPGMFQLPRVNHMAVAVLIGAAGFGFVVCWYEPRASVVTGAALVSFALSMGVVTAYRARPTNFYGVGLKFVTLVLCGLTCALGPTDGMDFLCMAAAAPLFAIVIIACCFGVGFFKILPRRYRGSKEEAK